MHGGRALLILATPGSGKTFTMTQRIIRLIEQDNIPPEKILVITFTKAAAWNMQQRFLKLSESSGQTSPVNFGTFHSLSYHILKQSGDFKSYNILTDTDKKKLINPIIKQLIQKEELKSRQDIFAEDTDTILNAISYYKNTRDIQKAVNHLPGEWQKHFSLVFQSYEQERRHRRRIDFDDMLYECYNLLRENPQVRERWQERFEHILIDEFQDINPMQYQIIRLLAQKNCAVFAVGDDDQSIYGFRGATPKCVQQFLEEFKAEQIFLGMNYRSRKEIIKASNLVIRENKSRFDKKHVPCPEKEAECYNPADVVQIKGFQERKEQYDYLLSQLRHIQQGKTVAILFRTNSYMQGLAVRLSREGIAYTMKEKSRSIYGHFAVQDIMAYFKVAAGKGSRSDLLRIMNKPNRNIARETLGEGASGLKELIARYNGETKFEAAQRIKLMKWAEQMEHLSRMPLFLGMKYIRKVIGYDTYLSKKAGTDLTKRQEWEDILKWLSEDAQPYKSLKEWMEAQQYYSEKQEEKVQDNGLSLLTIHAAKGLEFDKVYIPDCNEKVFPYGTLTERETWEEERRIFYVGMTRAKENLELLYLTGTKERPRLPSRFLNPLWKDYSSTNSSNSQLSRYSSNASATFSYSSSSAMYSSSGSSLGSSGFSE